MTVHPRRPLTQRVTSGPVPNRRGFSKDTGKLNAQMKQEEEERAGSQPIVEMCAFCGWQWVGLAAEGRAAFRDHLKQAHPEIKPKRPRRSGLSAWMKQNGDERDEAMVFVAQRVADAAKGEART